MLGEPGCPLRDRTLAAALAHCSFRHDGGLLKYRQLKVLRVTVRPGGGVPEDVIHIFRGL